MKNQWSVIERIIQGVEEPMAEREFVALCAALGVLSDDVLEWGLESLSVAGLLVAL